MRRARERAVGAVAGVALLGVAAAAAACTVFTSLDGLSGGDAGSPDGADSEDALGGGGADADGIVTPENDGAPDDVNASGNEAGGDADAGPFCASRSPAPLFCDDFDENPDDAGALTARWDQITGMGGSVVRSGGLFTSPPLAMLATANAPISTSIDLAAYKTFTGVAQANVFTLAFDIDVVTADVSKHSDAVLAAFELVGSLGDRWALQLEVNYDASVSADAGNSLDVSFSENRTPPGDAGYTQNPAPSKLPIGVWTHVTMTANVTSLGTATIALQMGSDPVYKVANVLIPVLDGAPEILVGLTYAEASNQGWAVRYDDVTFDVAP